MIVDQCCKAWNAPQNENGRISVCSFSRWYKLAVLAKFPQEKLSV